VKRAGVFLANFARSALRGLRGAPVTTGVAIATIAVALVLLGSLLLLLRNMQELLDRVGSELHVTAYLSDSISADATQALANEIEALPEVERVTFVSREEALQRFQQGVGRGSPLLEALSENPLPGSLEIVLVEALRSPAGLDALSEKLRGRPGIDDLSSGVDWVEGYLRALALLRGIGLAIAGIVSAATVLIIANTIRLAIVGRRDELEILSLVGASRSFMRAPFLLEGALQGLLGGAAALLILLGIFELALPQIAFGLELVAGGLTPRFFAASEAAALLVFGSGLGLFGSAAALAGGLRA
jgi:cell division transport system permease protein